MEKRDVIILGGISGISAGMSLNSHFPGKKTTLIRKEGTVLIPCGIPYIYGTVGSPDKNVIPDGVLEKNNMELIKDEAIEIDRENKIVKLKNGTEYQYEKLVLATGSGPLLPPIKGIDKKRVYGVKKEFNYLSGLLDDVNDAKDIVIIGGGFIGMEFADECRKGRDVNITVVEALSNCLQKAMDPEFCQEAEAKLTEAGVKILTNSMVEEFTGDDTVTGVKLANGDVIKADLVIVGIGAKPNTELAAKAGLELGFNKTIKVDKFQRSVTDPDIFACGDCAEKHSFFDGKPSGIMLASIAAYESRIAGANLFTLAHTNDGAIAVFSTMINGHAFAVAGLTEREANNMGITTVSKSAESMDTHPSGMANSCKIKIKLIFAKETGVIIGGAGSGGKSIGETLNIVSAAISHKMTADEIMKFQMGTHPALTPSPISYPIVNAALLAFQDLKK